MQKILKFHIRASDSRESYLRTHCSHNSASFLSLVALFSQSMRMVSLKSGFVCRTPRAGIQAWQQRHQQEQGQQQPAEETVQPSEHTLERWRNAYSILMTDARGECGCDWSTLCSFYLGVGLGLSKYITPGISRAGNEQAALLLITRLSSTPQKTY